MIRHLKRVTVRTIAILNIMVVVLMLLSGYAGLVSPVAHPSYSCFTLAFPLFLVLNLGFLVFWVIFKFRYVIIPFLGFVMGFGPVRSYTPFNVTHSTADATMKVLSYNTWGFGKFPLITRDNTILQYIKKQDADIVCLQESYLTEYGLRVVDTLMGRNYPYQDECNEGNGGLRILSKYPIIRKIPINFEQPTTNLACAWLLRRGTDTMLVVNCHLQSIGITEVEKADFKEMVRGTLSTDSSRK